MCGVVGVLRLPNGRRVTEDLVRAMRDTMVHRGPDDAGVYVDPEGMVGLGHRRLSILDLSSAGHGPMPNEDGSVWITYNGEVYNHQAIRARLQGQGHVFRSQTDTESLVHLYEDRGVSMLPELRGIFAFGMWDGRQRRVLLARDRLGVKPLYYAIADGQLIWASEIKALLAHPAMTRDLNESALIDYLTYAAVPAPDTLFMGIRKLPPGYRLLATCGGAVDVERWWTPLRPDQAVADCTSDADVVEHIHGLLASAVTEETMADVPHGVLLSGGVDSSLIVALLSERAEQRVRTFSVGFEDQPHYDERQYAARVAEQYGTEHRELTLRPERVMSLMPEVIYAQDEPISDWVCVPMWLLAEAIRESGVIVIQVGEGSDELFAGYPRYQRYVRIERALWRRYAQLPRSARMAIGALAARSIGEAARLREVRDLFRRAAGGQPMFISGAVVNWGFEKERLLSARLRSGVAADDPSERFARVNEAAFRQEAPGFDYAALIAHQDLMARLPELLLMRVDKMTMARSVEARVPFLDHRIVEFALALPERYKLRGQHTKYVLRNLAKRYLDRNLAFRPKKGFDVPISAWLRAGELGRWARATILQSGIARREVLDMQEVRRLLDAHARGSQDCGFRIWNLVNLCAWYDRWIDGVTG